MLTYIYTARNSQTGQKIKAEVQAADEQSAAQLLIERGLSPIEISVKREKGSRFGRRHKVPAKEKIIFSRQLATLVNAGVPLVQSLDTVKTQTSNKAFQVIIDKVVQDVEAGATFTTALSKYPAIFDDVYVSLIAAGEASGTLDKSLERLADQQEKGAEVLSKIRGAFIYPVIVLVVLVGVVVFMMGTVLPQVKNLYTSIPGAKLPFITNALLVVTNTIIHFWWVFILLLAVGFYFFFRYAKSPSGKAIFDRLKLRTWPFNKLFAKLYMARFSRAASTLVGSGVPLIKMLDTAGAAAGNSVISKAISDATEDVRGGKPLSDSLQKNPVFPQLVPGMIRIGEQSGQLENMLGKLADYYEKEVDNQIKSISTLVEPMLMIAVGVIAMIIVAAVLLPIYSLAGKNLQF